MRKPAAAEVFAVVDLAIVGTIPCSSWQHRPNADGTGTNRSELGRQNYRRLAWSLSMSCFLWGGKKWLVAIRGTKVPEDG